MCNNNSIYASTSISIKFKFSIAPTVSGKTVLMELAIIRVLLNYGSDSKIIYMAPTKSLCSERVKDWENRFAPFGIKCEYYSLLLIQLLQILINQYMIFFARRRQRIYWRHKLCFSFFY
jgi:hypothetical protein